MMSKSINTKAVSQRTCHIIRGERRSREITQMEMASQLGISQSALSKIENQTMTPTLIPWLKFCAAFGIRPEMPMDEQLYKTWAKGHEKKVSKKVIKPVKH